LNFEAVIEPGNSFTKHFPASQDKSNLGSRGIYVSKGTPISMHIFAAPPVIGGNIWLSQAQFGQTKPLMFSTTPITLRPVFLQKLISFLTSDKDTSYGVVTIIAPSRLVFCK